MGETVDETGLARLFPLKTLFGVWLLMPGCVNGCAGGCANHPHTLYVCLQDLNISHNAVSSMQCLLSAVHLRSLNVSHNKLADDSLPPSLGLLNSLWHLDISNNQFTSFPFSGLVSLAHVRAENNRFASFPDISTLIGAEPSLAMIVSSISVMGAESV